MPTSIDDGCWAERYALRRANEILIIGQENVRHVLLRIAVDQREPGAADVDHDAMARFEGVQHILQFQLDLRRFLGRERLRLFVTVAEATTDGLVATSIW